MEIRKGYKQTEAGVIPDDWSVCPLNEVVEFLDGKRRPVKDSDRTKMRGDFPYYGASGIIDYVNNFLFDEELILLGEDGENILSRNTRLVFQVKGKIWVNNHAHVLRPRSVVDIGYLVEFLESIDYSEYNTGTAQPKLNQQVCSRIPVAVPPLPEQRAIAAALSDVDALLTALDALIAKKRLIKQGAMQELLTGKKRLPGFSGEWEEKPIGSEIDLLVGFPFQSSQYTSAGIRLLRCSNIKRGHTDWADDITQYWSAITSDLTGYTLLDGDLVIAMDGSLVGRSYARLKDSDLPALLLQRVARIRSKKIDLGYLKEFVGSDYFVKYCDSVKTVTAIPHISSDDIRNFAIPFPPTIEEQTAIAAILSDMDAEITALEQRREKTRQLKQGMMQELLTGKTRLV